MGRKGSTVSEALWAPPNLLMEGAPFTKFKEECTSLGAHEVPGPKAGCLQWVGPFAVSHSPF